MSPTIRSLYDSKQTALSEATGLRIDPKEKRTKSSFKDECDINRVMDRYAKTGQLPPNMKTPRYGDFSDVPTYLEALQRVEFARLAFNQLPPAVRAECLNDPAVFLNKVQDKAWAEKHGLIEATPSPASPAPQGPSSGGQPDPKGSPDPAPKPA